MADIVTEPFSDLANSYADIAQADNHFEDTLHTTGWGELDVDIKRRALINATLVIDSSYTFVHNISRHRQKLAFPRSLLFDRQGRTISSEVFPPDIVTACILLAEHITREDIRENLDPILGGLSSLSVSGASLSTTETMQKTRNYIPEHIDSLISFYSTSKTFGGVRSAQLVR